ncbi:MAG: hypothetical protein QXQ14_03160 [Candidatus Aenigmatarchaeota archaeon]
MVKYPEPLGPFDLLKKINNKAKELGLIPIIESKKDKEGEVVIIQNIKPYILDFTTFLGKGSGALYSLVFTYSKTFKVFKVSESLYVSPTYQPYYQLTIKQKEELENIIKTQLAQIASAISDTELIYHDYRKYNQFYEIIQKIREKRKELEKAKKEEKEKIMKELKSLDNMLRNVFIDQVDVHTGDFSLINLARTRWTTIIADFLELDEEVDAKDVMKKIPNITTAEAIVLAKKNALYLEWRKTFETAIEERMRNVKTLLEMRKFSIESYKEMARPNIKKWLMYRESPLSSTLHFYKPESMMQAVESTRIWMIKPIPFYQYEAEEIKQPFLNNEKELGLKNLETAKKLGIEPKNIGEHLKSRLAVEPSVDRIVLLGLIALKENYNVPISLNDFLEVRNSVIKLSTAEFGKAEAGKEIWRLSPYYAFFDISLDRTILKMPDGTELEDVWLTISPYLVSQNIALLLMLQEKLIDKAIDNLVSSFLGEVTVKSVEIEVSEGKEKTKEKKVSFSFIEEIFKSVEEIEKREKEFLEGVIENCKFFYENYLKPGIFSKPKILYQEKYADEYFYDYVVDVNNSIKKLFFSMFGFPA